MSGVRSVAGRVGPQDRAGPERAQGPADKVKTKPRSRGPGRLHGHFQPRHGLSKAPARSNPGPDAVKTEPPPRQGHSKAPQVTVFFDRVGAPFCTCWPGLGGGAKTQLRQSGAKKSKKSERFSCWPGAGGMIQLCLRVRMRCEPPPSGARALCSHHFRARVLFSA